MVTLRRHSENRGGPPLRIPRSQYRTARTVRLYRRLLQSCADPLHHRLHHPTAGRGKSRITRCPLSRGKVSTIPLAAILASAIYPQSPTRCRCSRKPKRPKQQTIHQTGSTPRRGVTRCSGPSVMRGFSHKKGSKLVTRLTPRDSQQQREGARRTSRRCRCWIAAEGGSLTALETCACYIKSSVNQTPIMT